MTDMLDEWHYFSTPVYSIIKPNFLKPVRSACNKALSAIRKNNKINEVYPVVHADVSAEEELLELIQYTLNTGWNLLSDQGYNMNSLQTYLTSCWSQEHHKYSSMEQHSHNDCQLVAFYFLECPKDPPRLIIHDPRLMKTTTQLHEQDISLISMASDKISFTPEPGQLIFANSWLAHSFTRNFSTKPFKFIHMNISTRPDVAVPEYPNTADII